MSNELIGETDAAQWAHSFVNMFYLVPSEGAMIGWFANAIEAGRDAGKMPPEWFDKFSVYYHGEELRMDCGDCQKTVMIVDRGETWPTLRELIVWATNHRNEAHGEHSD